MNAVVQSCDHRLEQGSSPPKKRTRDLNMTKLNNEEAVIEALAEQLSDEQLDLVSAGIGNVIAGSYHKGDGNGEAAFYAGICMGLMGF
jgi:hypothetical protein